MCVNQGLAECDLFVCDCAAYILGHEEQIFNLKYSLINENRPNHRHHGPGWLVSCRAAAVEGV